MTVLATDLTVVIPTVGRLAALRRCVESIVRSDVVPTEVLVVDNRVAGDPHLELEVALPATTTLRVVREPRRSVGAARNCGLARATTAWVVFTDDDCVAPPGWLAGIRAYVRTQPDVAIAGGLVDEEDRAGRVYRFMRRINYMDSASRLRRRPGGIPSLGGANLLVRRDVVLALGGFDPTLASTEDYELLVRARARGLAVGVYSDLPPMLHCHQTDLRRFIRRYWAYGRGVAQTVVRHQLGREDHRVYVDPGRWTSVFPAAWRFAAEDLRHATPAATREWTSDVCDLGLALVRGLAWQSGALSVLGARYHVER